MKKDKYEKRKYGYNWIVDKHLRKGYKVIYDTRTKTWIIKNDPNAPEIKGRLKWYKKLPQLQKDYFWEFIICVTWMMIIAIIATCLAILIK